MAFELAAVSTDTTSVVLEFEFTGGDSSYGNYRPLRLTVDDTNIDQVVFDSDEEGGGESYWTIPISGLDPDTTYSFEAQLGFYDGETISWLSVYVSGDFTTDAEVNIARWSWEASNAFASDGQTQNAYAILLGTRAADDFSYLVWNDLVIKVADVREAKGYEWDETIATETKTKAASGDYLTADRFNSLRRNINGMKSVNVSAVSAGDEIYGSYIISLVDTLNEVIDTL